jgi:hypothetical protein
VLLVNNGIKKLTWSYVELSVCLFWCTERAAVDDCYSGPKTVYRSSRNSLAPIRDCYSYMSGAACSRGRETSRSIRCGAACSWGQSVSQSASQTQFPSCMLPHTCLLKALTEIVFCRVYSHLGEYGSARCKALHGWQYRMVFSY